MVLNSEELRRYPKIISIAVNVKKIKMILERGLVLV